MELQQRRRRQEEGKGPNALLFSGLTSATKLSLRFLSQNDLTLHPSQSLRLESLLLSSVSSISSLHSLSQTPPPPPQSPPPPPPPPSYWYLRFLASYPSDSSPNHRHRWLEAFRMTRPSFYLLLQILTPSLYSSPLPPPDHKLAAALFRLAHVAPLPSLARRFGLDGPHSASRAFHEVCCAICDRLLHETTIPPPPPDKLPLPPSCGGVIGHVRFGGIVAQGVVVVAGADGILFLDVSAGWSAKMSPREILPRSNLFSRFNSHDDTTGIGSYLLGDSCCPLLPWLLTPFEDARTPSARAFNDVHSRSMELVGKAFRELRVRWRFLDIGCEPREKERCLAGALPFVIVAGCLLHNFLVRRGEPLPRDGGGEGDVLARDMLGGSDRFEGKACEEGERVRDALASRLEAGVGR